MKLIERRVATLESLHAKKNKASRRKVFVHFDDPVGEWVDRWMVNGMMVDAEPEPGVDAEKHTMYRLTIGRFAEVGR